MQVPHIFVDVYDHPILVVRHGPIPLGRRQLDPNARTDISPHRTLPPPIP
jgi:hypothetical protein